MEKIQVLIAEDDPKALQTMKHSLSRLECQITVATNGKRALALIKGTKFDVIVLDIALPDMDGLEVFAKAKIILPNLPPVIVTTGYLDAHFRNRAIELGAFDYLIKSPLSGKQLRESIISAVGKRKGYEKKS